MRTHPSSYDVAVIGGGPVGCVAALAHARRGASVLLLEANPQASRRLAGEWLHPPAVRILRDLGLDLSPRVTYPTGRGFVVYPDDGSEPMVLPYEQGVFGHSLHHELLVDELRALCRRTPSIDYREPARVTRVVGQNLTFQAANGAQQTVFATQIVGASGRASVAHAALGLPGTAGTYSRMAGLLLEDATLPFEGFGHVCLGALGPILVYRISATEIRACMDVPLSFRAPQQGKERAAALYSAYALALPEALREPFRRALQAGRLTWATNQTRARAMFGRAGLALVGDAVGYHHPLTALGLTLGFQDALALAEAPSFQAYRKKRSQESRVPELLAIALYEVFADTHDEIVEIRRAIYDLWRSSPSERARTMRFLAGDETRPQLFAASFLRALGVAARRLTLRGASTSHWAHVAGVTEELGSRIRWLFAGAMHLTDARPQKELARGAEERWAGALKAGAAKGEVLELRTRREDDAEEPAWTLDRASRALLATQDADGSWEGEVRWGPALSAQWVLAWTRMGRPIPADRRERVLLSFRRTAREDGLWALSEGGEPSLFVTTLVYVAARFLGVSADDELLRPSRAFFAREGGVVAIPSWGKFWLAIVGLFDWSGVNPVPPAIWGLPQGSGIHPSRYHAHTRQVFLGMAYVYGQRPATAETETVRALRGELFPSGWEAVRWADARNLIREDELYAAPSRVLSATYGVLKTLEPIQTPRGRERGLTRLREQIRFELRTTSHAGLSPAATLLEIVGLWLADPEDPDLREALARFETWVWEDDRDGMRVAVARSASLDTALALRALAAAPAAVDAEAALRRGDAFLRAQQIRQAGADYASHHRIDPRGGWCPSGAWNGWPTSDATAEAVLARLDVARARGAGGPTDDELAAACAFLLRTQDDRGGFGGYEPKRLHVSLEWLHATEMFGESMTEESYADCTGASLAALARVAAERPHLLERPELARVPEALARGKRRLLELQLPAGCWPGSRGVHHVYGTMLGVRGLLAAGMPPTDPAIRKACGWLRSHQRPDGSWGERHVPHVVEYVEDDKGHVVQTAWALTTLLEARDADWEAIERAARFLAKLQLGSGEWPAQAPTGVFFHTALLDYTMHRAHHPVQALALFEARRRERDDFAEERSASAPEPLSLH